MIPAAGRIADPAGFSWRGPASPAKKLLVAVVCGPKPGAPGVCNAVFGFLFSVFGERQNQSQRPFTRTRKKETESRLSIILGPGARIPYNKGCYMGQQSRRAKLEVKDHEDRFLGFGAPGREG